MEPTEADNEIEEEHLLNFVVNSLDEELEIDIDENVKVTTETLYEVLAGASAGRTSINHVCETTEGSPHANTVRGHLTEQFELDSVEAVGDTLLQRDALETLPDRPVEACADLHLDPYYGDEDETEALYSSQAKRGTTTFHAYATLYARVRNKRYTLAVRQLVAGDTTSDVLGEFLELLDGLDLSVKAVYLDRGFYNSTCLGLLSTHNYAYVMPIVKWGEPPRGQAPRLPVSTTRFTDSAREPTGSAVSAGVDSESPRAWIRSLPLLLGGHGRASDPACFRRLSQTRSMPSHHSV